MDEQKRVGQDSAVFTAHHVDHFDQKVALERQ